MPNQERQITVQTKSMPVFILSSDESLGQVEAIVSVMGVRDLVDDIIHPGAYTKTLIERVGKIRVLDNHRTDSAQAAVGRPLQMRELKRSELPPELLAQYPEATGGLWTLTQFDIETPEGLGIFKRIQSGSLNEWSIGFDVIDSDVTRIKNADGKLINIRNIRSIRLWEYSVVLWGANQATVTIDSKGIPLSMTEVVTMPANTQNKSREDAPNYRPAPAGHDRCSTCAFFDPTGRCNKYDMTVDGDYISDSYKPGNQLSTDGADEHKRVEGVELTIGAKLVSNTYDTFSLCINDWLRCGNVTVEEHLTLVGIGTQLLELLTSAVPDEISQRTYESDPFLDMLFWAADGASAVKRLIRSEQKAGRVLSKANATKLVAAVETITEVLTNAGIYDEAQGADESQSASNDESKVTPNPVDQKAEPRPALTFSTEQETDIRHRYEYLKAQMSFNTKGE